MRQPEMQGCRAFGSRQLDNTTARDLYGIASLSVSHALCELQYLKQDTIDAIEVEQQTSARIVRACMASGLDYDVIVVGLGGHGSAALYHLAKRGVKVLGLEQYSVAHDRGSSHGESRIIRFAYHEHPDYVLLLQRAWDLWKQLEAESGQELLYETGCISASPSDFRDGNNCFRQALQAAEHHGLKHEILGGLEVGERFPGYRFPADFKAVLADGGILASERCVAAHVEIAREHGAEVRLGETVLSWHANDNGTSVVVVTDKGTFTARKAVLSAGSWMSRLVPELEVIGWFEILEERCCQKDSFPVCVVEDAKGTFYAFPRYEQPGLKIGKFNHMREKVNKPEELDRHVTAQDEQVLREGVEEWFPAANGRMLKAAACMFTNTPDHHFIVDRHPVFDQVLLCSACSGHGFKFCSVLGEILADLATVGRTRHDLSLHRISERRPGHPELLARFSEGQGGRQARL